ncbi:MULTISPECIES: hypothetical protein [unclassified Mesorhizobium]|uniref:hypothetical protein n=1 Tax=unclassified Mesorhizobium TaxID=325217 RepID=UPI0011292FED|nr:MULTISPECIES: hypothetical protein [unclassified Mesorhizobium]MBZ9894432.1 hypothetical protein [Mesorhizobium sp. BR1-1-6]TPM57616.1 hypothetical protein FJ959_12585 [Mesorhizobium sp. B2-2-4]TPM65581.1 hypothetical protein FJ965_15250 [Mesorhizobium sp. B2-2-1]TPN38509.1 hypothetical protein FJ979_14370 [Mesorhizobium sp. B1-1-6]TPN71907.1 hypothetical protein FJ984_03230 [Mesorhizobium sp. B1-1-3]
MRHDRLVLTLLRRELLAGLRSMRRRDLAWIGLGGGVLLAYAITDIAVALQTAAATLRQPQSLWTFGLPAALLGLGGFAGNAIARLCLSHAFAPFLKALPLSLVQRRRMAAVAACVLGVPIASVVGATVGLGCFVIAKPLAPVWGLGAAMLFGAGFGVSAVLRLRSARDLVHTDTADLAGDPGGRRPWLGAFDRLAPAWLSSWAWGQPASHVRPSWRLVGAAVFFGVVAALSAAISLVHHDAVPAAMTGLTGGLLVFMLSARFHPLGSPVLRTAPLGFTRAWLRLARLPLQLSVAFFLLPAGAAVAAEPSAWAMPLASGFWLLALNGAYAVFSAYFMTAPFVAALSFLSAIAYTSYESLEYGRTVLIGFAALVLFLWHRAQRRYRHG